MRPDHHSLAAVEGRVSKKPERGERFKPSKRLCALCNTHQETELVQAPIHHANTLIRRCADHAACFSRRISK